MFKEHQEGQCVRSRVSEQKTDSDCGQRGRWAAWCPALCDIVRTLTLTLRRENSEQFGTEIVTSDFHFNRLLLTVVLKIDCVAIRLRAGRCIWMPLPSPGQDTDKIQATVRAGEKEGNVLWLR